MSELMLKSVEDLLGKNYFIPSYQRGYRWGQRQVHDLLDDLYSFAIDRNKKQGAFYCLQPVVVKKCDKKTIADNGLSSEMDNNTWYEVIDGQQRLTTLFLIFKYLINENNLDLKKRYGTELFDIRYQTGVTDPSVIANPAVQNSSSPNAYYITEAYKHIMDWFNSFRRQQDILDYLQALLMGNAESMHNYGYVQVIWYETTEDDPIKTFTRLNIGKIPLRNAELVKALFLQKRDNDTLSEKQQIFIAQEWDQIESALQNKRIWAFLNSKMPDMPAHIEFIFNVIFSVEGAGDASKYGTDEYATFRFFSERFKDATQETIKKEWDNIREYYETFMEWYNNPLWYHYIGFLIYCDEPIINIYRMYKNNSKSEFLNNLIGAIRNKLKITLSPAGNLLKRNREITYVKHKDILKKVLVLYNIEHIVQKNKKNDRSYVIFPFDLFKSEKWDIEHVDSYTTNPLEDKKEQREWVKAALDDLKAFNIDYKTTLSEAEKTTIDNFINELDQDILFEEDVCSIISRLADEFIPTGEVEEDVKNGIGNLVLLNADINRGYGNAIFPTKKRKIIQNDAAGRFIPICTKNVFFKNFCEGNNTTISWSEDNMKSYQADIVRVIRKFLL